MNGGGSRKIWRQISNILRNTLLVAILITAAILFINGKPKVCHDEINKDIVENLCRGPAISDPIVIVFMLGFILLLGWSVTEFSVAGAKVLINNNNNQISRQILMPRDDTTSNIETSEYRSIHTTLKLLVAGSSRTFPSDDAFLIILYELKNGFIIPLEYSSSRSSTEDSRLKAITEARPIRSLASASIEENLPIFDWITPFPEVNLLVRKCVASPVTTNSIPSWKGSLVGLALNDGRNESAVSDISISSHLQATGDAIVAFLEHRNFANSNAEHERTSNDASAQ